MDTYYFRKYDKQNIGLGRFRYLNIFQLAEKTASQGWTPALAPRRGTAPRSWRARGNKMEGREVVRAFHWMLWKFKRRGFRERESADAVARFRAPFRRERVKKYSNRRNPHVNVTFEGTFVLSYESTKVRRYVACWTISLRVRVHVRVRCTDVISYCLHCLSCSYNVRCTFVRKYLSYFRKYDKGNILYTTVGNFDI